MNKHSQQKSYLCCRVWGEHIRKNEYHNINRYSDIVYGNFFARSEPWRMLYEEMLTRFGLSICWIPGILSLGDVARTWDATARAVTTEFMKNKGGKRFGSRYGS